MSEDKKLILKMLEENKISAEEAQKLLEAVKTDKISNKAEKRESNFSIKNLNGFINSVGNKAAALKDKAVPVINEVFENIKEKSSDCIDAISSSISYENAAMPKRGSFKEFDFEAEKGADICFKAKNGELNLRGYNGSKISGKVYFKAKDSSSKIDIINYKNKVYTQYNEDAFTSVHIDAIIPYKHFNNIELYNFKGIINAENLSCKKFIAENESGKIKASNILAKYGELEADNSDIYIDFNSYDNNLEQSWNIEANNTKVEISANERKNVYVSASSVLGDVKFNACVYEKTSGSGSSINLKSKNADSLSSNLKLNVSSSNNNIIIK